jgi:phage anti-repressor protein
MKKKIHNCNKCKERKIAVSKISGNKVIDSFELYHAAGMMRSNYTRWMTDTVLQLGCDKKDYIPATDNKMTNKKGSRKRIRYYLKLDFAISICLLMRRKKSMEIRNFLMQINKK